MKVIACAAQLGSGKNALCEYLAKKLNERQNNDYVKLWTPIGFANAVKKVFMDTFNVSWDFIEEWKRKDEVPPGFDLPIRKCLQLIGDGFRKMESNIWIEVALRTDKNVIIFDERYLNESQAVRDKGGLNILLWRPNFENNDPNPSESQIKPTVDWFVKSGLEGYVGGEDLPEGEICNPSLFDFFIRNEGTLEDLYRKADEILIPAIEEHFN